MKALEIDIVGIMSLFNSIYKGDYPDKTILDYNALLEFIDNTGKFICVAKDEKQVVGAVFFKFDTVFGMAKVYGAAVKRSYRGHNITVDLMSYGALLIHGKFENLDVIYATTRTVHKAAQKLTKRLGYKRIGIFPNVHKTNEFETHGLVAKFYPSAFTNRYSDFELHPLLLPLYNLVREEVGIPELDVAKLDVVKKIFKVETPHLEVIDATEFVKYRLNKLVREECIDFAFYPFNDPTHLITSPDKKVEFFVSLNEEDGHCDIIGIILRDDYCLIELLGQIINILRKRGARYLEMIIKAHRVKLVDTFIRAGFIPCAYIPAFQLQDGKRYDYCILSQSLENFHFSSLELEGKNLDYLKNYYNVWRKISLGPQLMDS